MRYFDRLRDMAIVRSPIMRIRALGRHPERRTDILTTVMYHGMPAHTRGAFPRQLDYMRSLGDFVTASQAVEILRSQARIAGKYFCVTFDDGLKDAFVNAIPILAERGIPSIFFIVPSWVSASDRTYMSWDDCRQLAQHGATVGSHSLSHHRFSTLDGHQAREELVASKSRLELETGLPCEHFACPWGQPGGDYVPHRDPQLAEEVGYRSFFTTIRGAAQSGASAWAIPRTRLEPDWGIHQLRYLFTR
ncbi:MAG: cda1 [Rhodospirillales bacterium]|nr:cda1 [Rhodospirillales bacterium]